MNNERTNGETSNEKVQTVYKDQIPRGPEAIATDKDGYVYVSCRESNVICRLTPGGNFQSNVLTTTDKFKGRMVLHSMRTVHNFFNRIMMVNWLPYFPVNNQLQ